MLPRQEVLSNDSALVGFQTQTPSRGCGVSPGSMWGLGAGRKGGKAAHAGNTPSCPTVNELPAWENACK